MMRYAALDRCDIGSLFRLLKVLWGEHASQTGWEFGTKGPQGPGSRRRRASAQ